MQVCFLYSNIVLLAENIIHGDIIITYNYDRRKSPPSYERVIRTEITLHLKHSKTKHIQNNSFEDTGQVILHSGPREKGNK